MLVEVSAGRERSGAAPPGGGLAKKLPAHARVFWPQNFTEKRKSEKAGLRAAVRNRGFSVSRESGVFGGAQE